MCESWSVCEDEGRARGSKSERWGRTEVAALGESWVWCVCRRSREHRPDCGRCQGCSLLDFKLVANAVYQGQGTIRFAFGKSVDCLHLG